MSNGENNQAKPVAAALPASNEQHPAWKRVVLYTDTVSGIQTCRDDLFAITTDELTALLATPALPAEKVQGLTVGAVTDLAFKHCSGIVKDRQFAFSPEQMHIMVDAILAASGGVPAPAVSDMVITDITPEGAVGYKHYLGFRDVVEPAPALPAIPEGWRDAMQELVNLVDDSLKGEYEIDSFTTQPCRQILAAAPELPEGNQQPQTGESK